MQFCLKLVVGPGGKRIRSVVGPTEKKSLPDHEKGPRLCFAPTTSGEKKKPASLNRLPNQLDQKSLKRVPHFNKAPSSERLSVRPRGGRQSSRESEGNGGPGEKESKTLKMKNWLTPF